MPDYTLRLRRYNPESGEAPHYEDYQVELEGHRSVLEAILKVKGEQDGSIGVRCSCRAAICGSCGVRTNGKPGLACHTHLDEAAKNSKDGENVIVVEPMGNMPVIKDLIVDMEEVHWKKIRRVTPWLVGKEPVPEREYIVPHENMVDVTQTMACIQCGACVSDCMTMEMDPLFIGPAALAKAYRFVGDPRDADTKERLADLAEDPHGIYDCTHCFQCIEACPKGVAPMSQIMRLRRRAGSDFGLDDRNNGHRHEMAFVKNIKKNGLLHEADLLPDSYGGKFHPRAVPELLSSLPVVLRALKTGKVTPKKALLHEHKAPKEVKKIFEIIESRPARNEYNLYISGNEDDIAGEAVGGESLGGGAATATVEAPVAEAVTPEAPVAEVVAPEEPAAEAAAPEAPVEEAPVEETPAPEAAAEPAAEEAPEADTPADGEPTEGDAQ
jgi:succinate dehydrogenase / fumarate reductase iron-sulfur subunit